MEAFYDEKPSVFSEVGNGSVMYHYDIEEVDAPQCLEDFGEPIAKKQYVCQEIVVWKPISSNRITEAVITDRWDSNYEQKLINEYNAARIGLFGELESVEAKSKIEAYTKYLTERSRLKAQVDKDCLAFGIA